MTIDQKLESLRKEYKYATEDRRKQILFTVKTIKRSKFLKKDEFVEQVEKELM